MKIHLKLFMCFRYIYYTFILSGLTMISIENKCLDELKYNNLIKEFVSKKCKEKLFSLNRIVLIIKYYNRITFKKKIRIFI